MLILPMLRSTIAAAALGVITTIVACSSNEETASTNACDEVAVDAFKELMVVEDAVLTDTRALNRSNGPWSFRYVMENMAPAGKDPGDFVRSWLRGWVNTREVNGFRLDRVSEERDMAMEQLVVCPWLRRTPDNQCNEDCSSCTGQKLDLATAPFRLTGIVNRLDQRDEVETQPSGEGRLVFGLTSGPADDPASAAMPMALIFEFRLPDSRTPKEWAEAWHALGKHGAFDEAYRAELASLTDSFVKRGANPAGPYGSALSQLRTNESVLNWIWQLREFKLQSTGDLRLSPLGRTPGEPLNSTKTLAAWVKDNAELIKQKKYMIPENMRSGSADMFLFSWSLPGVDEATRKSFAAETCNGCHSTENPARDTAFHISPFRRGQDRLSPFVFNPGAAKPDELTTRARVMRRTLCGG